AGAARAVRETCGPLVAEQAGPLSQGRLAEVAPDDVGEPVAEVADEQVEPTVIVVVPPPAREAGQGLGDAQRRGHVGERAVAVVAAESVRSGVAGDVAVRI